jgi:hypothetical protein
MDLIFKGLGYFFCFTVLGSVADPDPGSGAFLPTGSGIRIRDEFFPDPGSWIQGVPVCFWWDFLKNPCSLIFFTNKTCSWNHKKQEKSWFYFSSLFLCTVWSGIRDPGCGAFSPPDPGSGSGIKKLGIWIRDKISRIRNTDLCSKFGIYFRDASGLAEIYRAKLGEVRRQQLGQCQRAGQEEGGGSQLPSATVAVGLSCCHAPAGLGKIWDAHKPVGGILR